jgi:hypothetical protein
MFPYELPFHQCPTFFHITRAWKNSSIDICFGTRYSYHTYKDEGKYEFSLGFYGDKTRNSDFRRSFGDAFLLKDCVKSNVRAIVSNKLESMWKELVMSQSMQGDLSYSSEQS